MVIATRTLKLRNTYGDTDIPIRISAPVQEGNAWSCRYEIGWPEGNETMNATGADSVQAILVALQMIGADLYTSNYHKTGRLLFGSPGRGYGFPVTNNIRDLLIGDDAKFF